MMRCAFILSLLACASLAAGESVTPESPVINELKGVGVEFVQARGSGAAPIYDVTVPADFKTKQLNFFTLTLVPGIRSIHINSVDAALAALPHVEKINGLEMLLLTCDSYPQELQQRLSAMRFAGTVILATPDNAKPVEIKLEDNAHIEKLEFRLPAASISIDSLSALKSLYVVTTGDSLRLKLDRLKALRTVEVVGPSESNFAAAFSKLPELISLLSGRLPLTDSVTFTDVEKFEALSSESGRASEKFLRQLSLFPKLRGVNLRYIDHAGAALAALADSHLEVLEVPVGATDEDFKKIKDLSRLNHLEISGTKLTLESIKRLAEAVELETLYLADLPIDDEAAKIISGLKKIGRLRLRNTAITDAGVAMIATLPNLKDLDLFNTKMTNAGLKSLERTKLAYLNVSTANVDSEAIAQFRSAQPNVSIFFGPAK